MKKGGSTWIAHLEVIFNVSSAQRLRRALWIEICHLFVSSVFNLWLGWFWVDLSWKIRENLARGSRGWIGIFMNFSNFCRRIRFLRLRIQSKITLFAHCDHGSRGERSKMLVFLSVHCATRLRMNQGQILHGMNFFFFNNGLITLGLCFVQVVCRRRSPDGAAVHSPS